MIKVSKYTSLKNQIKGETFLPNTDNFLAVFIVFTWGRIFERAMGKQEVECNVKLRPNSIFL